MAVKKIKDIYKGYFQKSKVFLYPILGLRKGSITPIDTYISWKDIVKSSDYKLVCLFHLRDDPEFLLFEEKYLLGNPLFEDFKEVGEGKAIYIFNLTSYAEDFECFLDGKYSRFSDKLKGKIRNHYGATSANYAFVEGYLYPEEYFPLYAKFLTVNKEDEPDMLKLLMDVGELCNKPDFSKEELKITVNTLDFEKL